MQLDGFDLHSFAFLCAFLPFFAVNNHRSRKDLKVFAKSRKDKLHECRVLF